MTSIEFVKMQGLGNDFVVLEGPIELSTAEVRRLCDRHFGIGADGVLVVTPGKPIRMEYWNADGGRAEMCGNGLRCVARFAHDRGWSNTEEFVVLTPVGERRVRVGDGIVEAEIGPGRVHGESEIEGQRYRLVDVGNPHAVRLVDDVDHIDVTGIGRALQDEFDSGVNVEFIATTATGIAMRVWERGVGETMACGTGMVAAALASSSGDVNGTTVEVAVPGGVGSVRFEDGVAWLSGPADYSFRGTVEGR